jgi:hypothetical protein
LQNREDERGIQMKEATGGRRRRRILGRGKGMVVGRVGIEVGWCER